MIVGRRSHTAPEVLAGRPADARSDLYSLGVVLWQALAGRLLEEPEARDDGAWPEPSLHNPEVPSALDVVVLKMLAADPDDRYQRAEEAQAALSRLIDSAFIGDVELARFLGRHYDVGRERAILADEIARVERGLTGPELRKSPAKSKGADETTTAGEGPPSGDLLFAGELTAPAERPTPGELTPAPEAASAAAAPSSLSSSAERLRTGGPVAAGESGGRGRTDAGRRADGPARRGRWAPGGRGCGRRRGVARQRCPGGRARGEGDRGRGDDEGDPRRSRGRPLGAAAGRGDSEAVRAAASIQGRDPPPRAHAGRPLRGGGRGRRGGDRDWRRGVLGDDAGTPGALVRSPG